MSATDRLGYNREAGKTNAMSYLHKGPFYVKYANCVRSTEKHAEPPLRIFTHCVPAADGWASTGRYLTLTRGVLGFYLFLDVVLRVCLHMRETYHVFICLQICR